MAYLIPLNLAFSIILEVTVTLEAVLDDPAELLCERVVVEQVVYPKSGTRSLGRVGRADALLRRADAGTAQFDFLQTVDDLMEIEDKVGAVRDEQATSAVETCVAGDHVCIRRSIACKSPHLSTMGYTI